MQFTPDQNIVKGFNRIAKGSKTKIKDYLLKKAGITIHDIRIISPRDNPIKLLQRGDIHDSHYYYFFKKICNSELYILNSSGTSPVILSIHFFVETMDNSKIDFITYTGENKKIEKVSMVSKELSFLYQEDQKVEVFTLPVLKKGSVRKLPENTFEIDTRYALDSKTEWDITNKDKYIAPPELVNDCIQNYKQLTNNLSVWIAIELDNEELLPYKWDWKNKCYKRGFFYDGLVI
jgi:hypothetical protein